MHQILDAIWGYRKYLFKLLSLLIFLLTIQTINNYEKKLSVLPGELMNFSNVAKTFERIGQVSARLEITNLLAQLFKSCSPEEAEIIANVSLGLLRSSYKGSTYFNMAEKSLLKVIATLVSEPLEAVELKAKELGDLGLVIQASDGWKPEATLSITEVYDKLLALEKLSGLGSQEEKYHAIVHLLRAVDPESAKYIVRIIVGKLRLGFSDMTLVDALSWMEVGNKSLRKKIEEAYNVCADIGYIARVLKQDGIQAIEAMHSKVGIPVRMAAAERLPDAKSVFEKLGTCIAQPKLDGFRLQVHVDAANAIDKKIDLFSRNLLDMTQMFPDLAAEFKKLNVETLICEGEAIVYDPNSGVFVPFQETVKRKRKHGVEQAITDYPLQIFLFDILYLNGKDLMNETHAQRRNKLIELLKDYQGDIIQIIPEVTIESTKQLENYFLKNVSAGLEGIMIKKDNSTYQAGKRNFNWIKLKRVIEGHLEDTIDCVILGYYAGSGKRVTFGIGAFLVGVYNEQKDCFQTVAKIGTGLKDVEWIDLKTRCDALRVDHKPINVEVPKELYPDVWVSPELMCIVRADEITLSPIHTAGQTEAHLGFALRFPRFVQYRTDKSPQQSTTPEELMHMYKDQLKKQ